MNDKMKALLMKGKKMSPMESKASDGVLGSLMDHISGLEGDKVKGIKKVTVASNDPAGLEAGLAKAKAMVAHGAPDASDADDSDEDSMLDDGSEDHESDMDNSHEEPSEDHPATEEELDQDVESLKAQIEELKALLASR